MNKKEQLKLIYSDFVDMRVNFYACHETLGKKEVLCFDKKSGYFLGKVDEKELYKKMLASFDMCNYSFSDFDIQAFRLVNKFIRSLPVITFVITKNKNDSYPKGDFYEFSRAKNNSNHWRRRDYRTL